MADNHKIHTIFFGTHNFAVTILQALIDDPKIFVDLVITQPDKPVGRKKELTLPPVKILAEKHGLKIQQPASLKNFEIRNSKFEIGIVAEYGLLIPENIFNAPEYGTLNVHTSLLPKYRGASPIQSALINGETKTGVTIMKMDKGLDTGPILLQKSLNIAPDDTYPDLDKKLAKIGSEALLEAIPAYVGGKLVPVPQDESKVTTCKQFEREDGKIDWNKSAEEIYNQYRGMTPWPGVWTAWENKRLKLIEIKLAKKKLETGKVSIENGKMYVGCGENSVEVFELQLEGKSKMDTATFLNGFRKIDDSVLL